MLWKISAVLALAILTLVSPALADDGEDYRQEKTVTATIGGGFVVAPVSATAFELGYFATPDLLLQVGYSDGTFDLDFFSVEASVLEFDAKYFIGNSFYVKGGLADRQLSLKNVSCYACGTSGQNTQLGNYGYVASLVVDASIGNEWQFKYLTLGCDWFGVMEPLAILKSQTTATVAANLSASDQSDLNDTWSRLGKTLSFELLHFYIGLSF